MKKLSAKMILVLAALCSGVPALAASGDDILGPWYNQDRDAKIDIFKCGEKYCGKIVWMKNPNYPDGSKDGQPGTPKLDHNNPNPELRKVPRLGLEIVKDMAFAGGNKWADGTVYDPNNGSTYSGKFTLEDPDNLDLRGFVGISLFGRTSHWSRKEDPRPADKPKPADE